MNIDFKFKFNDEVYVVSKTKEDEVLIYKDVITEVSATETRKEYFTKKYYDSLKEEELVLVENKEELVKKIDQLLNSEVK